MLDFYECSNFSDRKRDLVRLLHLDLHAMEHMRDSGENERVAFGIFRQCSDSELAPGSLVPTVFVPVGLCTRVSSGCETESASF